MILMLIELESVECNSNTFIHSWLQCAIRLAMNLGHKREGARVRRSLSLCHTVGPLLVEGIEGGGGPPMQLLQRMSMKQQLCPH